MQVDLNERTINERMKGGEEGRYNILMDAKKGQTFWFFIASFLGEVANGQSNAHSG